MARALPAVLLVLCLSACERVVDPSSLPPPDRYVDIRTDEGSEPASDIPAESEMLEEVVEDTVEDVDDDEAGLPETCTTDLGDFTPGAERAAYSDVYSVWLVHAAYTSGFGVDPFSHLSIESWLDADGPTTPGTYDVTERVSTHTCGLCLFVCEGCPLSSTQCSECDHTYVATRGTLELLEVSITIGERVSGSLVDAYFAEVEWSTDTLIPDGLGVCVDMWSFDEVITDYEDW